MPGPKVGQLFQNRLTAGHGLPTTTDFIPKGFLALQQVNISHLLTNRQELHESGKNTDQLKVKLFFGEPIPGRLAAFKPFSELAHDEILTSRVNQ